MLIAACVVPSALGGAGKTLQLGDEEEACTVSMSSVVMMITTVIIAISVDKISKMMQKGLASSRRG